MDKTGYYIYSVLATNEERTFDAIPIGVGTEVDKQSSQETRSGDSPSAPVYTICHNGLAAVVSDSKIKEYPITRENMLAHQRVNEIAMREFVLLPVRFCTIAEDKNLIIERLLKGKRNELLSKLEYLKNKNEFGLKVLWKEMEQVFTSISEENADIKKLKSKLEKLHPSHARGGMIEIGQMVKDALLAKKEEVGGVFFNRLIRMSVESKKNQIYGDRMLLNAVFLVEKANEKAIDDEINRLADDYSQTMNWKYIGPAPAANFVEITVQWTD